MVGEDGTACDPSRPLECPNMSEEFVFNYFEVPLKFSGPKETPVRSGFLTIISHVGPTHLQQ